MVNRHTGLADNFGAAIEQGGERRLSGLDHRHGLIGLWQKRTGTVAARIDLHKGHAGNAGKIDNRRGVRLDRRGAINPQPRAHHGGVAAVDPHAFNFSNLDPDIAHGGAFLERDRARKDDIILRKVAIELGRAKPQGKADHRRGCHQNEGADQGIIRACFHHPAPIIAPRPRGPPK